jgi:hypothetical protein
MRWQLRAGERRRDRDRNLMRVRITGKGIGITDLIFEDGYCIEAPTRLAAAVGRSTGDVQRYCWRRGWMADIIS